MRHWSFESGIGIFYVRCFKVGKQGICPNRQGGSKVYDRRGLTRAVVTGLHGSFKKTKIYSPQSRKVKRPSEIFGRPFHFQAVGGGEAGPRGFYIFPSLPIILNWTNYSSVSLCRVSRNHTFQQSSSFKQCKRINSKAPTRWLGLVLIVNVLSLFFPSPASDKGKTCQTAAEEEKCGRFGDGGWFIGQ